MADITQEIKSTLKYIGYNVDNLLFKRNPDFKEHKVEVLFDVASEVQYFEENKALVTVTLVIFPDAQKNDFPFSMDLSVTGEFQIENYDQTRDSKLFEINAVSIMFPYLRALISTITANANVAPLILPPINVIQLLQNKKS